ncbi:MAG: PKD domain-containing protein, partial [Saprospiraceae bacterium]|nr:PKD domain-containing protein [Saprospiraceae bacterium]
MKRLLLLLAILGLMYSHLSSQTAEEYFSTEGLSINSYHFNAFDGTYSTALTYYDKIMLCGEEVLRFYRNDSGIPFYLKIEGQKGYRVFGSCSTRLLFDYDLEVGEVVPEGFYQNFVVTDKYPVTLLNGEQRMRFDLDQNGYTISWIEGVGDIQNGLFPIFEDFEGYDVYVCTKIGDELLWQNEEEAAFCDILACAKPQIRYNASIDEYLLSVDNHSIFADVFEWDFGDGNQSSEKDPTHQYDTPGCYSLSLLVGNDCHTNDPRFLENVPVCFADTWEIDYVVDTFGSMYVHRFSDELEFTHAFYGPYLHRSTDGGQTWQPIELPPVANGVQRLIYEIKMFDANRGVMACGHYGADSDQKAILVTQDGGLTWEEKVPGSYFLRNLEVTEDGKAWVMGSNNYIYRSLDYGESWETLQYPALSIRTVQYINESLLIGNGYTGIQPWQETYLIKSYDEGLTWDTLSIPNNLSSWHFFNENLGYAKQGTQMAKTTDGGLSWELLDLGFGVARFSFATPNAGWIVDQTGLIH